MNFVNVSTMLKIRFATMLMLTFVLVSFTTFSSSALAAESTEIPVPKSMIYAGKPITASQLRGRVVPNKYLSSVSVFVSPNDIIGKIAKFNLAPARPIRTNQLDEPDVVSVNRPVIMKFVTGSLTITAEVIPLNSAKAGESVRVRNMQSNAIVYGVAMNDGTIAARLTR